MALIDLNFEAMHPSPAFDKTALESFVAAPRIAILAYTRRDGTPTQFPIWYEYADGRFYMTTSSVSAKAKALARSRKACLTIQDEVPPYRAVVMDGEVTQAPAPIEGGISSRLATRYFGKLGGREYEKMAREEAEKTGLTLLIFEPTRVRGFDNHKMIGAPLRLFMRIRNALPIPASWI